jgi:hypothetical protein
MWAFRLAECGWAESPSSHFWMHFAEKDLSHSVSAHDKKCSVQGPIPKELVLAPIGRHTGIMM